MSTRPEALPGFPSGFHEHRQSQAGIGLTMTPAERLRWLEEAMDTFRRWQGRARPAVDAPVEDDGLAQSRPK